MGGFIHFVPTIYTFIPMAVSVRFPYRPRLMAGSLDDRIGKRDFRLTIGVAKMFAAGIARPVFRIAVLRTGGGFRFGLSQLVAGCLNDRIGKSDFRLTLRVAEMFAAGVARPVFRIAFLGTGGIFVGGMGQRVDMLKPFLRHVSTNSAVLVGFLGSGLYIPDMILARILCTANGADMV